VDISVKLGIAVGVMSLSVWVNAGSVPVFCPVLASPVNAKVKVTIITIMLAHTVFLDVFKIAASEEEMKVF
jgi:hypothetical protein